MTDAAGDADEELKVAALVRCEVLDAGDGFGVGVITLDSPATLNALSLPMVEAVDARLAEWEHDADIVAVWLDASSDKAFCAGGDLQQLYRAMHKAGDDHNEYAHDFFEKEYRLDYRVHRYPKPIVAWMHGIVMGGGLGLACGAAHRVVTERSMLAMPEVTIGLFPDVGGSWFLSKIPGRIGRYLALTGARLKAADAIFAGLADLPIPQAAKPSVLEGMKTLAWTGNAAADEIVMRRHLHANADWSLAASSEFAARFPALVPLCSVATVQEAAAAIAEYAKTDPWAGPHAQALAGAAPSSLALAWAMQERLAYADLAHVLRAEFDAAIGCSAYGDFAEGIRALIIDKDKKPQWTPATLAEADTALVDDLVRPRWLTEHPLADLVEASHAATSK